ncbi:MAG: hypothetical protein AVDCRST_MAG09-1010 [uncultured Sphingomonas sp.]|uniref:Uncharacterized protein n=1 Tax=uncultured Sphingomonas sp. TaxID=158754 RepID=A0A6J4SUT3_9SPHN|nr:MAG: hypothetical protein AVDCRST_MAG09-1010 [uncultured Sphingomonas sp.]
MRVPVSRTGTSVMGAKQPLEDHERSAGMLIPTPKSGLTAFHQQITLAPLLMAQV